MGQPREGRADAASFARLVLAIPARHPIHGTAGSLGRGPGLTDVGDVWTASLTRTEIAVALRRFRLDRGAYPERLDDLAPAYLETLPFDPFTGRLPEYARSGNGFELRTQLRAGPPDIAEWKLAR